MPEVGNCTNTEELAAASMDLTAKLSCHYARACIVPLARALEASDGLREAAFGGRAQVIKLVHAVALDQCQATAAAAGGWGKSSSQLAEAMGDVLRAMMDGETLSGASPKRKIPDPDSSGDGAQGGDGGKIVRWDSKEASKRQKAGGELTVTAIAHSTVACCECLPYPARALAHV